MLVGDVEIESDEESGSGLSCISQDSRIIIKKNTQFTGIMKMNNVPVN